MFSRTGFQLRQVVNEFPKVSLWRKPAVVMEGNGWFCMVLGMTVMWTFAELLLGFKLYFWPHILTYKSFSRKNFNELLRFYFNNFYITEKLLKKRKNLK